MKTKAEVAWSTVMWVLIAAAILYVIIRMLGPMFLTGMRAIGSLFGL
jgi:hypothetical protein